MQTSKIANKKPSRLRRKIDYKKIARAYGILRNKRLKPLKVQRSLRDQWE